MLFKHKDIDLYRSLGVMRRISKVTKEFTWTMEMIGSEDLFASQTIAPLPGMAANGCSWLSSSFPVSFATGPLIISIFSFVGRPQYSTHLLPWYM